MKTWIKIVNVEFCYGNIENGSLFCMKVKEMLVDFIYICCFMRKMRNNTFFVEIKILIHILVEFILFESKGNVSRLCIYLLFYEEDEE